MISFRNGYVEEHWLTCKTDRQPTAASLWTCYLYEAGIRTLEQYPSKESSWYQGESKCHNMDAHKKLIQTLVEAGAGTGNHQNFPSILFSCQVSTDHPGPGFGTVKDNWCYRFPIRGWLFHQTKVTHWMYIHVTTSGWRKTGTMGFESGIRIP